MWPFKKKVKEEFIEEAKFKIEEFVSFRHRNDLKCGYIYKIKKNDDGSIVYDIQIGGECPAIVNNIPEDKIFRSKKYYE
jgi:hypothetical protein